MVFLKIDRIFIMIDKDKICSSAKDSQIANIVFFALLNVGARMTKIGYKYRNKILLSSIIAVVGQALLLKFYCPATSSAAAIPAPASTPAVTQ